MAKKKKEKGERGRPTKFNEFYEALILRLASIGLTEDQLAAAVDVTKATLWRWKKERPEFFENLIRSKRNANRTVEASLYQAATGYSHPEDKIFMTKTGVIKVVPTVKYYPPDVKAIKMWLINRDPEKWRDRSEVEHSGGIAVNVINFADVKMDGEDEGEAQDTTAAKPF